MIWVNGEPIAFVGSVADLLADRFADRAPTGIAVAVDEVVIARSTWEAHVIDVDSQVEIVTATQGG